MSSDLRGQGQRPGRECMPSPPIIPRLKSGSALMRRRPRRILHLRGIRHRRATCWWQRIRRTANASRKPCAGASFRAGRKISRPARQATPTAGARRQSWSAGCRENERPPASFRDPYYLDWLAGSMQALGLRRREPGLHHVEDGCTCKAMRQHKCLGAPSLARAKQLKQSALVDTHGGPRLADADSVQPAIASCHTQGRA
jgi:hypothetical protein